MVKIWYNRIFAGTHKLSEVPDRWAKDVRAMIEENYLNAKITKEEYNKMLGIE